MKNVIPDKCDANFTFKIIAKDVFYTEKSIDKIVLIIIEKLTLHILI